ncbi:MAG: hypothetical protein JNL12_16385 [Planctomycetes bacterium]|nr:hypothetical protein [Planctomycetota bacterium]
MTRNSLESWERLFVIGLLALVAAGALWIRDEAAAAEAETIRREHLLQTLLHQRAQPDAAKQLDPSRFEALFVGRRLCWEDGPAGRYLALGAAMEARR